MKKVLLFIIGSGFLAVGLLSSSGAVAGDGASESKKCLARLQKCFVPSNYEALLLFPPDQDLRGGNTCADRCNTTSAPRDQGCDVETCTRMCEVAFEFAAASCPNPT